MSDHQRSTSHNRIVMQIIVLYSLLSLVTSVVGATPNLRDLFVSEAWDLFWVVGPPANLLYGASYCWMYIVGTCVWGGCVAVFYCTKQRLLRVFTFVLAIVSWCMFGFMVYGPAI